MLSSYQTLIQKIDPERDKSVGVDLSEIRLSEYHAIIQDFIHADKDISQQWYEKPWERIETKLDFIWLYFAFSLGSHSLENNADAREQKLQAIHALDAQFYPIVKKMIENINVEHNDHYNKHKVGFHKKLLHINGALFNYFYTLKDNVNLKKHADTILKYMPLSFSEEKLNISRQQAQDKTKKDAETGFREKTVNNTLRKSLQNIPQIFSPLRKVDNISHLDHETGLELDFPLHSKIAIETDGIHHTLFNGTNKNNLIHEFKAALLREYGWTRVSIPADNDCANKAKAIAKILHISSVQQFAEKYLQLSDLAKTARAKMIELQIKMQSKNANQDALYKYFDLLMAMDKQIRRLLVEKRHLESLLNNPHDENTLKAVEANAQTNMLKVDLKKLHNIIEDSAERKLKLEIDTLTQQIEREKNKIPKYKETLQRIIEDIDNLIEKENMTEADKLEDKKMQFSDAISTHIPNLITQYEKTRLQKNWDLNECIRKNSAYQESIAQMNKKLNDGNHALKRIEDCLPQKELSDQIRILSIMLPDAERNYQEAISKPYNYKMPIQNSFTHFKENQKPACFNMEIETKQKSLKRVKEEYPLNESNKKFKLDDTIGIVFL